MCEAVACFPEIFICIPECGSCYKAFVSLFLNARPLVIIRFLKTPLEVGGLHFLASSALIKC